MHSLIFFYYVNNIKNQQNKLQHYIFLDLINLAYHQQLMLILCFLHMNADMLMTTFLQINQIRLHHSPSLQFPLQIFQNHMLNLKYYYFFQIHIYQNKTPNPYTFADPLICRTIGRTLYISYYFIQSAIFTNGASDHSFSKL